MPWLIYLGVAGVGAFIGSKATSALSDKQEEVSKIVKVAGVASLAYVGYGIYSGNLQLPVIGRV